MGYLIFHGSDMPKSLKGIATHNPTATGLDEITTRSVDASGKVDVNYNPLHDDNKDETEDYECEHNEHDHGICLDCGKDIHDNLVSEAEYKCEGDR